MHSVYPFLGVHDTTSVPVVGKPGVLECVLGDVGHAWIRVHRLRVGSALWQTATFTLYEPAELPAQPLFVAGMSKT